MSSAVTIGHVVEASATHGSSELDRVAYLDGWRGLAILLVLQGHFFIVQGWHSGRMGVDVFFCLSGLLMSRILFVKRVPLTTFYKRRISRIIPSFFLFLLVVFGVAALIGQPASLGETLSTALFLRSYVPTDELIFASHYPIGHLWSLNVEEHSYVFLSLLTLLPFLRGREGWVLIGVGTATAALHWAYFLIPAIAPPGDFWVRSEVASTNLLLAAGYALLKDRMVPHVRPWMPLVSLAAGSALYIGSVFPWMLTMTVAPYFFAFTVNHLAETPAWFRRALSFNPLRLFGIASFSLYLWQQPFYQYKKYVFPPDPGYKAIVLLAVIAFSFFIFYVYENRVRAWLNRVW
ncbi:acyltransferase family protein [Oryzibacter oryziterrae]|uniref:acyltransferase family protein n=1 Tax=Oryzibacter oryziterrae TaxID=2766474 RepID=UPI001F2E215F|nr:acyltransferase [Oryzibacter oryziterrae]